MAHLLTPNAVATMYNGQDCPRPVLQVIDIKKIQGQGQQSGERFRLVLSDSRHFIQAMLTTALNPIVYDKRIEKFCFIRLTEYLCNTVHGRRVVIVLQLEVAAPADTVAVGQPANIEGTAPAAPAQQPPAPVPAPAAAPIPVAIPLPGGVRNNFGADLSAQTPVPISQISPYLPRSTVRARVSSKTEKKTYNSKNGSGTGTLFSMDLVDGSGEIKCAAFNEMCEYFYPHFEVGKVYLIHKPSIKFANKRYSTLAHDYEMSLDTNSLACEAVDDATIPKNTFSFVSIVDIKDKQKDDIVDIVGVIKDVKAVNQIKTRNGAMLSKREVVVGDEMAQIDVTFWAEKAENFNLALGTVVALKHLKVSDFGGRSLGTTLGSVVETNLDDNERGLQLQQFWAQGGADQATEMLSTRSAGVGGNKNYVEHTLADIDLLGLGKNLGETAYIQLTGWVWTTKGGQQVSAQWYDACPTCNKKVTGFDGDWRCDKCNKSMPNCSRRYMVNLSIADYTGQRYASCFNEAGEVIFGKTADELYQLQQASPSDYEIALEQARYAQFIFKLKVSSESYNGESKTRVSIDKAIPIDFKTQTQLLEQKCEAEGF